MAIPDKDFQEIKNKIAKFTKEELAVDEKEFNVKHTFAQRLPYLEEKK
jgi:acyl-CoA dehydrogenase